MGRGRLVAGVRPAGSVLGARRRGLSVRGRPVQRGRLAVGERQCRKPGTGDRRRLPVRCGRRRGDGPDLAARQGGYPVGLVRLGDGRGSRRRCTGRAPVDGGGEVAPARRGRAVRLAQGRQRVRAGHVHLAGAEPAAADARWSLLGGRHARVPAPSATQLRTLRPWPGRGLLDDAGRRGPLGALGRGCRGHHAALLRGDPMVVVPRTSGWPGHGGHARVRWSGAHPRAGAAVGRGVSPVDSVPAGQARPPAHRRHPRVRRHLADHHRGTGQSAGADRRGVPGRRGGELGDDRTRVVVAAVGGRSGAATLAYHLRRRGRCRSCAA